MKVILSLLITALIVFGINLTFLLIEKYPEIVLIIATMSLIAFIYLIYMGGYNL